MAGEAEAARNLTEALRQTREGAEDLDADTVTGGLACAGDRLAALSRAGATRARRATETARALGMPAGSTLAQLARSLSGGDAERLGRAAADLGGILEGVAREVAVLGVCARFGAASCAHLIELRQRAAGAAPSYGPGARLGGTPSRLTCRA